LVDQQATEDAPFSLVVPTGTFADVDLGDTLTYSATLADGAALPTWLSFNPATRTFTGTPLNGDVGSLNIAVKAMDLGGLSVTNMFGLAIQNVNDAPTVANPLADQTVSEDAPFSTQVLANAFADEDAGDVLSYSATLANGSALPTWLSFNATTRTFTGTPDDAQVGSLDLRVTATDTGNLSVSDVLTLTVANVNEAPTVVAPLADQQARQGTVFSLVVPATTFADVDAGDALTYSATLANGASLPSWLSFNPVTRTFNGTPQAGDVGTIDVRVTATDHGNLNAADAFALTIAPSGGTAGNDTLIGTSGNDVLDGLAGNDVLRGLAGNDTLIGGGGNDLLDGGLGTDSMTGGTGNDTYIVDVAGDIVTESLNSGTDTVQSNVTHTLGANVENLTLTGTAAINGTGNALGNILTGNSAANILTGGAGNDVYVIGAGDTVVETANAGLDTVLSDVTTTLSANVELLVLTGTSAINGTGNSLTNTLSGNNAANTLDGGAGADILAGLDGNDTYLVDNTGDTVIELANNGIDTVQSSVTYTLAANVENLTLTGAAAINGTGNTLDNLLLGNSANNTLIGGAGNDTLDGGAGNDTMVGGTGNDTYVVTAVGDVVTENANEGMDTVQSSLTYTLGANVEHLTLTGTAAINGTGNILDNQMIGNSVANQLSGANGNDTLRGGLGNDMVNGGAGNDTFLFGRGDGQDLVQDNSGTADKLLYDTGINPLDLVISRQANNLRLSIHGSTDQVTIQNWYTSSANRTEAIQAGNGQTMLSTQVDQLIQAMAGFTQQTGLTWDQAIDQRPQEVQAVLAASWQ
jgi:trimeric autotransporter adhesin